MVDDIPVGKGSGAGFGSEFPDDQPSNAAKAFDEQPVGGGSKPPAFDEQPVGGGSGPTAFDDMPVGGGNKSAAAFDEKPVGGGSGGFDEKPVGGGSAPNAFDDLPVGGGAGKSFDDQPVGGGSKPPAESFDDLPVGGGSKAPQESIDDKPVGGGSSSAFDDKPVGGGSGSAFDEKPVGGSKSNTTFDEKPVGGGSSAAAAFDDQPVGGGSGSAFDEKPVGGGSSSAFDDKPLGGGSGAFDEKPVGGGSAPNAFDDKPVGGGGKPPTESFDEKPIGGGNSSAFDDKPVGGSKPSAFDEQPIGGSKKPSAFDEQPIGGSKGPTAFDEQPIGGGKGPTAFDEKPIGGGNSAAAAFDEKPIGGGSKPSAFDEQPIGGSKGPSAFDEQPIGGGGKPSAFDEQPIGGGGAGAFGSEFPPGGAPPSAAAGADESDKPLNDRLISKNWSVRAAAFDDLKKEISGFSNNCSNDTMTTHLSLWASKYLNEANAGALEKVLDCFAEFIKKSKPDNLKSIVSKLFKPMIEKCLGQTRASCRTKSLECMMLFFEVSEEFGEEVEEQLVKYTKDKRPKIFQTSITLLAQLLLAYGINKFPASKYLKQIETAANSSSPVIRAEAMNCYKACFRWVGEEGIEPVIAGLKQVQKDSLKKEFDALKDDKSVFKRKTRSQQASGVEEVVTNTTLVVKKAEEEKKEETYETAPPKDILKMFGEKWISETLALKKWDKKRDQLISVQEACGPRLAEADYTALFEALKKMAADAHAAIAQNAIKAIGCLANGLRPSFHDMALQAVPVFCSKFKEKRIVEDIMDSMQKILLCVSLGEIIEPFKNGLKAEKATVGKLNMLVYIEKAVRTTFQDPLEDVMDDLVKIPISMIEDKDAATRDQCLTILGVMVARLGDSAMSKYVDGLPEVKKKKIQQAKETVKPSEFDHSERKAQKAAAKKPAAKPKADVEMTDMTGPSASAAASKQDMMMMDDDMGPPKRAPPKLGQKRPAPKKPAVAAGDGDSAAAPPKKGPGGPPARLAGAEKSNKPSTGTAKIISVKDIKEEDIGSGLGKEEAINKVTEFYGEDKAALFNDAKWAVKVQGFHAFKEKIEAEKPNAQIVEATAKFIKAKMKDWKESNLNLMKESIFTFQTIAAHCESINKRTVATYAPFFGEKVGDIKMSPAIKELYVELGMFVTAKFTSMQIIKYGLTTKAPNNIKEALNLLGIIIEEYGAGKLSLKETIDFSIFGCAHANKNVRDAAMALLSVIYKHLGPAIEKFIEDIKPSTKALIDAEFQKVTPYKKGEYKSERVPATDDSGAAGGGGAAAADDEDPLKALSDAMPREDISKQLNAKLLKMFTEDWKAKVKACELVNGMLAAAKQRITPDGIGELMDALFKCFKDPNKAVLKQAILMIGNMAEAVGDPILKYAKKCFVPMLNFLGDKAALMRADVITSANKWGDAIGNHYVINYMSGYLADGNPQIRDESLKWMVAHKESIPKCDHQLMVKPLVVCCTDRKGEIRTMAEEVMVQVICIIGPGPFQSAVRDLKPAVQGGVKPIVERAKGKAAALNPNAGSAAAADDEPSSSAPPGAMKKTVSKPGAKTAASKAPSGPTLKPSVVAQMQAKKEQKEAPQNSFAGAASKTAKPAIGSKRAPVASRAAAAPVEEEEFMCNPGNKERRALTDSKSKWMHEELNKNQVLALQKHCEDIFGHDFQKLMFGADFKKHVQCIQKFIGMIQSQPENLQEIVDIIFKWIYVKMTESSNTTFALNVYDFYNTLFNFLIEQQYIFWDHEAQIIIPMLCGQSGVNNKTLQAKIKGLIKQCFELHDQKKTLVLIIKYGCSNKNLKSVAESLDEVAVYLSKNGLDAINETQTKVIAKQVEASDAGVREKALQALSEIYKILDEDIWQIIGKVSIKVKGLLEQRFKKVKGGLGASTSKAGRLTTTAAAASPQKSKLNSSLNKSLNKSFNPKNNTTTPRSGLKFSGLSKQQESAGGLQKSLKKSFGGKNSLTSSFKAGLRPGTAVPKKSTIDVDNVDRNTAKVLGSNAMVGRQRQGMMDQDIGRQTEIPSFHVEMDAMNDDDEDLTAENPGNTSSQRDEEPVDAETAEQMAAINKHINNLKYSSELSKRVESLIALNDIIQAIDNYEKGIKMTANSLIGSFTHALKEVFDRPRDEIPLRFAKYFVTIVNKTCSCKKIMTLVNEQDLYELGEQLLTRLLIDKLDQLGDDKEGEFILRNLNGSMLRCLENCNKTSIFCVLFNLLRRYKDTASMPKLPGLIIKCLLKLSKILEKVISELESSRVLITIHLYLISIDHEKKSSNDEMGIRIVKTLVHEMVKDQKRDILKAYQVVERHEVEDKHLIRWIKIILNSFGSVEEPTQQNQSFENLEQEANAIIEELRNNGNQGQAVAKLHNFLTKYPHLNLDYYLRNVDQTFAQSIKVNLERYRTSLSDSGSTPNAQVNNWMPAGADVQPQERPGSNLGSSMSKAGSESRKFGFKSSAVPPQSTTNNSAGQQMSGGSSFRGSASSRLFPASQRPMTATNAGSTGGLNKTNESSLSSQQQQKQPEQTSNDRINTYTNKLSAMRDKFQQRKSVLGADAVVSTLKKPTTTTGKKNLNTSFSAMNSSLQAKWTAAKTNAAAKDPSQLSSTMAGSSTSRLTQLRQSSNQDESGLSASQNQALQNRLSGGTEVTASNKDLNKKLQEMKAKLAALKKTGGAANNS